MGFSSEKNTGSILNTGTMVAFDIDPVLYKKEGQVYYNDSPIQPIEDRQNILGLIVDIGTTTVVVSLIDMEKQKEIGSKSGLNPQREHGQEVMSRISYVQKYGEEGLAELQRMIVSTIEQLGVALCKDYGYNPEDIFGIFTASNAVMDHILMGISPVKLGIAPYEVEFKNKQERTFHQIGMTQLGNGVIMSLPNVSAFVGGDIIAGMVSTGINYHKGCELFIDIGTNGELILEKDGELYSTSCAAGPAMEGMNISCGVTAQPGAIEEAVFENDQLVLQTIADEPAIGICGSGILALVREFLKSGYITNRGNIAKGESIIIKDKKALAVDEEQGIYISQKDIRQIQLSKGAILTGIHFLLRESNTQVSEIERVYIAGQFGSYLSADSLTIVGLLPEELHGRIEYVGNSSKSGCYMVAMSRKLYNQLDHLVSNVQHIELSLLENFDRAFAKNARFTEGVK